MTFLVTLRDGTKFKADMPDSKAMLAWLKECGYVSDCRIRPNVPADRQVIDWHPEGIAPAGCPL